MQPITPNPAHFLLPDEYEVKIWAKDQPQYIPLLGIRVLDGRVATQWKPEPNDLLLIASGVPITLVLHTFGGSLQPIQIMVGGADLR